MFHVKQSPHQPRHRRRHGQQPRNTFPHHHRSCPGIL